jgi:type I restriction enzyme S subunit
MKPQSRWTETRLKYLCRIVGGGTPAKENLEFWNGYIPWVSPKDMGAFYVSDAEDHITTEAVAASATQIVPKGSVIVVVRSGILRHTIPVAVTTRHVAINQDMKALIAHGQIMPEYLAFLIVANQDRFLGQWRRKAQPSKVSRWSCWRIAPARRLLHTNSTVLSNFSAAKYPKSTT